MQKKKNRTPRCWYKKQIGFVNNIIRIAFELDVCFVFKNASLYKVILILIILIVESFPVKSSRGDVFTFVRVLFRTF